MADEAIRRYKLRVIATMFVWGTVGLFVKEVDLDPIEIAFFRSFIGCIFIVFLSFYKKEEFDIKGVKENLKFLVPSGVSLGLGWGMFFLGYKYTSVSNTTLAYYIAPIIIIIMSVIILKEKITLKKLACVALAMVGLVLIVKSNDLEAVGYNHRLGISYAIIGGFFYACLVILNKFIKDLSSTMTTMIQLCFAALTLLPFVLFNGMGVGSLPLRPLIFLLIVGVVHTGILYIAYLSAVPHLEGQTLAILSYIDPIVAVLVSGLLLKESMTLVQILGGLMILAAAFISEYKFDNKEDSKLV